MSNYNLGNNPIVRFKSDRTLSLIGGKEFHSWYLRTPSNAKKVDDVALYITVLKLYNRMLFYMLLTTGKRIKLPFSMGCMYFSKTSTKVVLDENNNIDKFRSKLLENRSETSKLWKENEQAKLSNTIVYYVRDYFASLRWLKGAITNRSFYNFKYNDYCSSLIKDTIDGNEALLDLYEDNEYDYEEGTEEEMFDIKHNMDIDLDKYKNNLNRIERSMTRDYSGKRNVKKSK